MSPTGRTGALLGLAAVAAVAFAPWLGALAALVITGAAAADAWLVRRPHPPSRSVPPRGYRGVALPLTLSAAPRARVRQPRPTSLDVTPSEGASPLSATAMPRRRGRVDLPPAVARHTGPLGLARRDTAGEPAKLEVYPDLPGARRMVSSLRRQRRREPGAVRRGPLGLGTEFELVREYSPDDDVRQVNWRATARLGRPMSNQYRVDQDRQVVCLVDAGRLMLAPVEGRTRLDAAMDALAMLAAVADEVGDRFGAVVFDREVRAHLAPGRRRGRGVVQALFDVAAQPVESDYELAFRSVASTKRSLVVVLTDLLDEAAASSLLDAMPVLTRRHAVVVASARDTEIHALATREPAHLLEAVEQRVAGDLLARRAAVAARLRRAGAEVVEAPATELGPVCAEAYLRLKRLARL